MKDNIYIDRIIKYAKKICKYMDAVKTFSEFENNDEKIDAVTLNLEQIGETAKKISNDTKEKYTTINWPSIIGLRNMISHDYEGIKLNIIYDITNIYIPKLLESLVEHN